MIPASQIIVEDLRKAGWPFKRDGSDIVLNRADSRFSVNLAYGEISERPDIGNRWHLVVCLSPGNPTAEDEFALMRLPRIDTSLFRAVNDHEQRYVRWAPFSSHYANADPLRVSRWVVGAMGTISERLVLDPTDYENDDLLNELLTSGDSYIELQSDTTQMQQAAFAPRSAIRTVLSSIRFRVRCSCDT